MPLTSNSPRMGLPGGRVTDTFPSPGQREIECLVGSCRREPNPLAPVALCGKHLREVHEFTAALVAERLVELESAATGLLARERATPSPTLPDRGAQPGWVYALRFGDRVKIGWSSRPYQRIAQHPHDAVLAIIPGSVLTERALHRRLRGSRVAGHREWFHATTDVLQYLADQLRESG